MGIKTNPLKILKKILVEEKKRGQKPYKKIIKETRAHLVDSRQMLGLPERYFQPQPSDNMKIMSWNVRGLNALSKHRMLKKGLHRRMEVVMIQETKCDKVNMKKIAHRKYGKVVR
jgi:hypothetical protein